MSSTKTTVFELPLNFCGRDRVSLFYSSWTEVMFELNIDSVAELTGKQRAKYEQWNNCLAATCCAVYQNVPYFPITVAKNLPAAYPPTDDELFVSGATSLLSVDAGKPFTETLAYFLLRHMDAGPREFSCVYDASGEKRILRASLSNKNSSYFTSGLPKEKVSLDYEDNYLEVEFKFEEGTEPTDIHAYFVLGIHTAMHDVDEFIQSLLDAENWKDNQFLQDLFSNPIAGINVEEDFSSSGWLPVVTVYGCTPQGNLASCKFNLNFELRRNAFLSKIKDISILETDEDYDDFLLPDETTFVDILEDA